MISDICLLLYSILYTSVLISSKTYPIYALMLILVLKTRHLKNILQHVILISINIKADRVQNLLM